MSASRRRSGRGKGGGGGNANGANPPKGGGGKPKAKKLAEFWEVPGASPEDLAAAVSVPDDPTALVRSLGAPALPGQGSNAEHYFTAVYDKASHVAFALATANGLLAHDDADQTSSDPADQVSPDGPDADATASA